KALDWSAEGRVLAYRQVRTSLVVVAGMHRHGPAKMCLAEYDHVVNAFAPYRTDQTLHVGVYERGAVGRSRMPSTRSRRFMTWPKTASRSRTRYLGVVSHGNASVICP